MNRMRVLPLFMFIVVFTFNIPILKAQPSPDPVIEAAQKGVDFIVDDAIRFENGSRCFSCHITAQAVRSAAFAEKSPDLTVDIPKFNTLLNRLYTQQFDGAGSGNGAVTHVGSNVSLRSFGRTTSAWAFFGMSGMSPETTANFDEDRFIRGADYLLRNQATNGSVSHDHFSPPVNVGLIMTTSQALHVWQRAFTITGEGRFLTAVGKAKDFLLAATPVNVSDGRYLEDATWIALGLTAAGVPIDDAKVQAMVALIKSRHLGSDSGWSIRATSGSLGGLSDAFGTGVGLCGLLAARETESSEFQDGLRWIVSNQQADGGWLGAPIGSRSRVVASTWATLCLAGLRASGFPEAGTDDFLSVAVFELGDPSGAMIRTPMLLDRNTTVGRSGPLNEDDPAPENVEEICSPVFDSGLGLPAQCVPVAFPEDFGGVGRREVETELLSLNLVGGGFSVKAGKPALDLLTSLGKPELFAPSVGEVESQDSTGAGAPGTDFLADSFFNVYAVIETPGGVLFNKDPLLVVSRGIDQFPPIAFYPHSSTTPSAVALFAVDDPDGPPVTFLKRAVHGTRPEESTGIPVDDPRFEGVVGDLINDELDQQPPLEVPGEVDFFRTSKALVGIRTSAGVESLILSGPTNIHVDINNVVDPDGNGLEQVTTEMVQLDLTGNSPVLGAVTLRLRSPLKSPFMRSTGLIEEMENNTPGVLDLPPFAPTGIANSFFDVFFEVEVGGQVYHANDPSRMEGIITHKPPAPGDEYAKPPGEIELFDEDNNPTGIFIVSASHVPDPLEIQVCDCDGDTDVDINDIRKIFAARGQAATGADDPRDADGDGVITVNDGRQCVLRCTNANCAP